MQSVAFNRSSLLWSNSVERRSRGGDSSHMHWQHHAPTLLTRRMRSLFGVRERREQREMRPRAFSDVVVRVISWDAEGSPAKLRCAPVHEPGEQGLTPPTFTPTHRADGGPLLLQQRRALHWSAPPASARCPGPAVRQVVQSVAAEPPDIFSNIGVEGYASIFRLTHDA